MTDGQTGGHPASKTRRRLLEGLAAGTVFAPVLRAADREATADEDQGDPREVLDLWIGPPPGGIPDRLHEEIVERPDRRGLRDRIISHVTRPRLTVFRASGRPRGALLLLPGGGYRYVVVDKEGFESARWLASRGITVFVLFYRLPADGWSGGPDAPLQDAQRAMRLIRTRAEAWNLDPSRLGVLGFSAGGHLAAQLACRFGRNTYPAQDEADTSGARPDVAALIYPVIAMDDPAAHAGSREQLLGTAPTPDRIRAYSVDRGVPGDAPPTFLLHAADDRSVPPENSLRMTAALRSAGVPADLHLYSSGGHGFGLRNVDGKPVADWPGLLRTWLEWRFSA